MTTALDWIKGALRRVNSYQSGEQIAAPDESDCLETLNDLLDSLSTDKQLNFGSNENILTWTANKTQYTIGNPRCTDIGLSTFTGTATSGSNVITGVTQMPSGLVAGTSLSSVGAGSTITDSQSVIPAGTYVTAKGSTTVTLSANATANSQGLDQFTYTLPGDFPIARPLRITSGFTRFNALDFDLDVYASQEEYTDILYKAQPGPWPTIAWYNNQFPYGILNVYQAPGNSAEVHLFTDTILQNLTLNQTVIMPQGYSRAFKWLLAREIWVEYVSAVTVPLMLEKLANEALSTIKALNAKPAQRAKYDRALVRGNRIDGGWITHGGYR